MSTASRFPLRCALALIAGGFALSGAARGDDSAGNTSNLGNLGDPGAMLRGPHPFLKENALSAHVLLGLGGASTPSGTKIGLDYGYRLRGPAWLDLQLNLQHGNCGSVPAGGGGCPHPAGSAYEILGGVKGKWATALPIVPFVAGAAGLVYAFPTGGPFGVGVMARVSGGANYFFFDWLGAGVQVGYSLGHVSYPRNGPGASYGVVDFGAGLEYQF
jgi:hypothetical protein